MRRIIGIRSLLRIVAVSSILSAGSYLLPKAWVERIIPLITGPISLLYPEYKIQTGWHPEKI